MCEPDESTGTTPITDKEWKNMKMNKGYKKMITELQEGKRGRQQRKLCRCGGRVIPISHGGTRKIVCVSCRADYKPARRKKRGKKRANKLY